MVKFLKKIIFSIFIFFIVIWTINYSFWENNKYISLHPLSSSYDVKKFQKFFKALNIYKWDIDWKYKNIKPYIINFQLKNNIIKNKKVDGAGYVWPKTYNFFINKYWYKFKQAYSKYFKITEASIENENCFVVSAYYSPLPGQKRYSTKSYKWDIRLNWNWTHWASWAAVHPWFIAAPSSYPFWTKIQIEWLGIWVVEDRWGAIVKKGVKWHNCDRLDIWMWYWDKWLIRALKWWKKEVKWKILNKTSKITIIFPTEYKKYLAQKVSPESKKEDIKSMQDLLYKAKIYDWKKDWKYLSFKKSIISFQIKNKIIKNKNDYAAGYIGPQTIKALEKQYPKIFIVIRRDEIEENKNKIKINKIETENKNWTVPEKIIKKKENIIITKNSIEEKIIAKYKISIKQKGQIEIISTKLKNKINKLYKNNNLKKKTEINKIRRKVEKVIGKIKNVKTKNQLIYLKDILKEMSK